MKNTFGNALTVTLFGESHGPAVGAVLDGLAPGIPVNETEIAEKLALRRPSGDLSTARREPDPLIIESGVYQGKTTGTPLCLLIPNQDKKSRDYSDLAQKARPAHCDYPAFCKYHGFSDPNGGGHFSGRITAPLVAAGAILQSALQKRGIVLATHIQKIAGIADTSFDFSAILPQAEQLAHSAFPVLNATAGEAMRQAILQAKADCDSVGGVLETAVVGLPAGVGEPWFDSLESVLSHALFSIPAVKGVEFGDGFALADARAGQVNDAYRMQDGTVVTATNHMGGIGGGISNGMPLLFRCAVKPTPSIAKPQPSVNFITGENVTLTITGRHDPCVVHRAKAVVDAMTAISLSDLLTVRFGTDWLAGKE